MIEGCSLDCIAHVECSLYNKTTNSSFYSTDLSERIATKLSHREAQKQTVINGMVPRVHGTRVIWLVLET